MCRAVFRERRAPEPLGSPLVVDPHIGAGHWKQGIHGDGGRWNIRNEVPQTPTWGQRAVSGITHKPLGAGRRNMGGHSTLGGDLPSPRRLEPPTGWGGLSGSSEHSHH